MLLICCTCATHKYTALLKGWHFFVPAMQCICCHSNKFTCFSLSFTRATKNCTLIWITNVITTKQKPIIILNITWIYCFAQIFNNFFVPFCLFVCLFVVYMTWQQWSRLQIILFKNCCFTTSFYIFVIVLYLLACLCLCILCIVGNLIDKSIINFRLFISHWNCNYIEYAMANNMKALNCSRKIQGKPTDLDGNCFY